ncbi:HPr family phosphocarrier protein [Alkalicoccus urumqiensis]|uniref:PTS sorbose transporter subunit IIC n=1 Tax=Alkalicoccus urumqiensis TaxID=1548213 RepID=A0A2P6MFL7_ALKUR|nr:HPr family phosphocarrier protein [Alkalicoccus urumqiensis]PRO65041.1 PTS sorbose transporter subunit IIC [Alkalicoccus urumqiensis]
MNLTVKKPIFAETASTFVNRMSAYEGDVLIKKDHWVVDAKSLLGVLALSLQPGDTIELDFSNEPDEAAVNSFRELGLFE